MEPDAKPDAREFLTRVTLLASLPPNAMAELGRDVRERRLRAGERLFDAGDPADAVYFVASGQLEVLHPGPRGGDPTRVNVVGAGAVVGELAVLRREHRSAAVRAVTETLVYSLGGARFIRLIHDWPGLALAIARQAAEQLVQVEKRAHVPNTAPLWLVARDRLVTERFTSALVRAAARYLAPASRRRPIVVLGATGSEHDPMPGVEHLPCPATGELHAALDEAACRAELVVLFAPMATLAAAAGRADGVIRSDPWSGPALPAEARHIEITRSGIPGAGRVKLGPGGPVDRQVDLSTDRSTDRAAARAARLLLDRAIGLALGGGAALGLAHLGVLDYLEEHAIPIDFIAGTSIGAVVGGVYAASGLAPLIERCMAMTRPMDWLDIVDRRAFATGVMRGDRARRFLDRLLAVPDASDLITPFAAIAFNVQDGEEVVLERGRLTEIIFASMAIPGLFEPAVLEIERGVRRPLVDGGMINHVPVDTVRAMGASRVIGVNVMARPRPSPRSGRRWLASLPGLSRARSLAHVQLMSMARAGERQVFAADVVVTPETGAIGFHEFWKGPRLVECGRRACEAMAAQLAVLTAPE